MSGVQFPSVARDSSLRHRVHTGSGAHPASYTIRTGFLKEIWWPEREAYHTLQSNAEVENGEAIPPFPDVFMA
jgi:hypothetical protein